MSDAVAVAGGFGNGFALIIVLFILLVILGCFCGRGYAPVGPVYGYGAYC
ncbi:YjcZ family sporulation protein [Bacillus sp. V5-8f]|nr:YjcZ family sporulation protein [Bacillus sp. V5-8f]PLT35218.1 sporulation protein YjcZ [Bacillus sp. V5-8f]